MIRFYAFLSTILAAVMAASALPPEHFAQHSVLAEGHWVKISVPSGGLYRITPEQLRSWGFDSPEDVRVYGYGGRRIPDHLTAENCIDDLPMVQSVASAQGIIFYAVGPEEIVDAGDGLHYTVVSSPYSTAGYYFLCENGAESRAIDEYGTAGAAGATPDSHFTEVLHHEIDRTSPGEAGPMLVGEEFRLTPQRSFNFNTPGCASGHMWLQCSFLAVTPSAPSYIDFYVNGTELKRNSTNRIPTMSSSSYQHAMMTVATLSFDTPADKQIKVDIKHSSPSSPVYNAWLNYLTVNYTRKLEIPSDGSPLAFRSTSPALRLENTSADVNVWDVTDPLNIRVMRTARNGSAVEWSAGNSARRDYVAFSPASTLPSPEFVQNVANSDLHSHSGYDMVIFTPSSLKQASERIAALHSAEPDTMQVVVVDIEQVYNEFAGGAPDVSALRKYLKMLYDRGSVAGHYLRYALLMGRPTYDNRRLTANMQRASWPTIPCWVNHDDEASLHDSFGFGTDDFIAMLEDGSGISLGLDRLCVAVGRISASSPDEAGSIVDKMDQYLHKSSLTPWKNVVVMLADDGDAGVHVRQAESMINNIMEQPGQQHVVSKIYTDAYELIGGNYPQAREEMYRRLDEGAAWWCFIGHANNHSWTGEGLLTYTDINNIYFRNIPFIYAATCNFLRWDSSTISGGEIMYANRNGGCIGMISATRPVYITDNGYFSNALGRALSMRDSHGRYLRAGDIYRHAKNNITNNKGQIDNNENRLRYVFCGDPALRLVTPSDVIRIDSIDGVPFDPDDQPTLAALQQAVVSGHIEAPDGSLISDFEGTATLELYDAEHSLVTHGNNEGDTIPFDIQGSKLLSVSAPVSGGRFHARLAMPADISDNFRPAMLNMYAASDDRAGEAIGVNRDLFVYGIDVSSPADNEDPAIDLFVINHNGFRSGDAVSTTSPMVIASVSDNVGINISSAGIGHQISLMLDGVTSYSDISQYYRPHPDGSPGGTFNYPMPDIAEGLHSLRLRVWDTSGNTSESTIEFFAKADVAPQIFDLYSDVNPAHTSANFYLTHDAPDAVATITVTVYNMLGSPVWTRTVHGRSDMFTSTPVTWNLCDGTGRRVPRGIYVYSATISVNGVTHRTASRRLAVAAY